MLTIEVPVRRVSVVSSRPFDEVVRMKEMARTVPDAASYAPVTILVAERADGVHLSYDSMASLIAPYGSQAALAVARDLDAKRRAF
jgi:hypothetical protein